MLTCAGAGSRRGTISLRKFVFIASSGRSPLSNTCLKSRAGVELRSMMGLYGILSVYMVAMTSVFKTSCSVSMLYVCMCSSRCRCYRGARVHIRSWLSTNAALRPQQSR